MRLATFSALAALVLAGAARASGVDDANAGLAALNGGDNDRAISLFNRALGSGDLAGDDREFGLACRGRAYLRKGDYPDAVVDLDDARRIKPDDADAQADLLMALAAELPPSSIPGAPRGVTTASARQPGKPSFWSGLGQALAAGAAAGLAEGLQNASKIKSDTPN